MSSYLGKEYPFSFYNSYMKLGMLKHIHTQESHRVTLRKTEIPQVYNTIISYASRLILFELIFAQSTLRP